jgi:myo-inositol-1(or 4)-monophosphatase
MLDLKKALDLIHGTTLGVGGYLHNYQQDVLIEKHKIGPDVQTNADLEAEKIFFKSIEEQYPDHNIFSEEFGYKDKNSEYTWYIDPLDGTIEYSRLSPLYLTTAALQTNSEVLVGSVYMPAVDQIYLASKKTKSTLNNKNISVSKNKDLGQSIIQFKNGNKKQSPEQQHQTFSILEKIALNTYRTHGFQNIAWNLCMVAQGVVDGFALLVDIGEKWQDVAAGLLIAKQAGAKITNRYGKSIKLKNFKDGIIVTNGLIHDQLLDIINS